MSHWNFSNNFPCLGANKKEWFLSFLKTKDTKELHKTHIPSKKIICLSFFSETKALKSTIYNILVKIQKKGGEKKWHELL
ncbi:protein of unknown function [Candidatus Methylacidiphilum fumarolicum]|uniref:Uncharacterized protein n=1 Tax=Candidatus Methylacidiphilum fumarolicum TaxID=591154 RepID=A0ABM9IG62_9BACT|nr:protein of unknown function [Candidatus Methylacidiphilum fumarolicum]